MLVKSILSTVFTSVFLKSSFYIRRNKKCTVIQLVQDIQKLVQEFVKYSDLHLVQEWCYTCAKQLRYSNNDFKAHVGRSKLRLQKSFKKVLTQV